MTNVGGILRNDPIEFRNLAEVLLYCLNLLFRCHPPNFLVFLRVEPSQTPGRMAQGGL